ncbi:MAG: preprotein translocase subunit SecE [Cyanothece sp. SIO1E1]|nr:preprotein translocase subunit SecE [Cyanothece sp. SIO1E1]
MNKDKPGAKTEKLEPKSDQPEEKKRKSEVSKPKPEPQDSTGGPSIVSFLQGTKEELDKVVWPSRQQLISESIAVILMVTLSATLIYLVDGLFGWASRQVF